MRWLPPRSVAAWRKVARVGADRRGLAAIEFALIAPVLILMLLGAVNYFDAVRDRAHIERAAYVAADAVSRQEIATTAFLDLLNAVMTKLGKSVGTVEMRISSVSRPLLLLQVDWSYTTGTFTPMQTSQIPLLGYPVSIPVGESAIIVETRANYRPLFKLFGSSLRTHTGVSFAKPRTVRSIARQN